MGHLIGGLVGVGPVTIYCMGSMYHWTIHYSIANGKVYVL